MVVEMDSLYLQAQRAEKALPHSASGIITVLYCRGRSQSFVLAGVSPTSLAVKDCSSYLNPRRHGFNSNID